jgi:hypothetical protein
MRRSFESRLIVSSSASALGGRDGQTANLRLICRIRSRRSSGDGSSGLSFGCAPGSVGSTAMLKTSALVQTYNAYRSGKFVGQQGAVKNRGPWGHHRADGRSSPSARAASSLNAAGNDAVVRWRRDIGLAGPSADCGPPRLTPCHPVALPGILPPRRMATQCQPS